jgi:hypothetical protein
MHIKRFLSTLIVIIFFLCDVILKRNEFLEAKYYSSYKLHHNSPTYVRQSFEQISIKITANNSLRLIDASENLMKSIKSSLVPPSSTYFQEPIADLFIRLILCFSVQFPYRQIGNLITWLSITTAIPIFLFMQSDRLSYRRIACVFFQIKSILDCIDGPIIRLNPNKTSLDSNGFFSGRTMDALGSTIPTVGFLLGYSIFLLRNAFLETEKCGRFKPKPTQNCLTRFCLNCAKICFRQKYEEARASKTQLSSQSNTIIEMDESISKSPKFGDAIFYLVLLIGFLNLSGIGWNFIFNYFKHMTSEVKIN